MLFGSNNLCHNETLNIKTDYGKYEICDVIITLMTSFVGQVSEKLCKNNVLGDFTFLSIKCVIFDQFSGNSRTMYLDDCALIPNIWYHGISFGDRKPTILRQKLGSPPN